MSSARNPFEMGGTPLGEILHKENRAEKNMSFEDRAEHYNPEIEKVINTITMSTLAKGVLTATRGMGGVNEELCKHFVSEHRKLVTSSLDTVPEEDLPAAIYLLLKRIVSGKK
jgi:hypothetical protein